MKTLSFILLLTTFSVYINASTVDTVTCKRCHPIISSEFDKSIHSSTSIYDDKIHKAVWDKHPDKASGKYKCAKCHTPQSKDMHASITCLSCHTITNIEEHNKTNTNIYETKPKTFYSAQKGMKKQKVTYQEKSSWFGMVKSVKGSPFHDIDYRNIDYYTGKMCMGCHSHKKNEHDFSVCDTEMAGAKNEEKNCITCHMPQVPGSATTIRKSNKHAFHGFAGVHNDARLLAKYINIKFEKLDDSFTITIENRSPHSLLTHPLRVIQLRTTLKQGDKSTKLKTHNFAKIIGTEGKPSMPWLATEIVKDNMIKAHEKRVIPYSTKINSGDGIEVQLGYYMVNPKAVKALGLNKEKKLTEFKILKTKYFSF